MSEQAEDEQIGEGAGIQRLMRQLKQGANWIERRDAANALALAAREIVLALRMAAEADDPDVSYAANQELDTLGQDATLTTEALKTAVIERRRTLQIDQHGAADETAPVSGAAALSVTPSAAEVRKWLDEIGQKLGGHVSGSGERFEIQAPLENGRAQRVYIDVSEKDSDGTPLIRLTTWCGPARDKVTGPALKMNAKLSHAAFAFGKREGEPTLMLVGRRRLAGYTAGDLEFDVKYFAEKGDRAEEQLVREDTH